MLGVGGLGGDAGAQFKKPLIQKRVPYPFSGKGVTIEGGEFERKIMQS